MLIARQLALGRLVSLTGGSAAYIALVATVFGETGSALWISAALLSSVVASVLAAPFAGWLGDRFDRRRVLIASDLLAGLTSLAMAASASRVLALVILLGLSSIAQSPFEPASAAALPSVVSAPDVARANGFIAATSSAAYLLGPLLGGVLLALGASAATVFIIDASTFAFSALLILSMKGPFGRGAVDEHPGALAGARLVVADRRLRVPILAGMVSLLGIGIVDVASYPLSRDLGGGTAGYGAMAALLGGGGLLGALVAGSRMSSNLASVLPIAFAAAAAGFAVAGSASIIIVALAGLAIAGAGRGIGDVAGTTLLQARAPNGIRSRVFATQDAAAHIAFVLSALVSGLLVTAISARGAFASAAACAIGAAIIAWRGARSDSSDALNVPRGRQYSAADGPNALGTSAKGV